MTNIPHFHNLRAEQIDDIVNNLTSLKFTEKLDGTYVKLGIDEEGLPYIERKGGQRFYKFDDFPNYVWTNAYRVGMSAGFKLIAKLGLTAGQYIDGELLYTDSKSFTTYGPKLSCNSSLVLFSGPHTPDVSPVNNHLLGDFTFKTLNCGWNGERYFSTGLIKWYVLQTLSMVNKNQNIAYPQSMLVSFWKTHGIPGFYNRDIFEMPLNKKPPNIGNRNWTEFKQEVREAKEKCREWLRDFAEQHLIPYLIKDLPVVITEGIVCQHGNIEFKIITRDWSVLKEKNDRLRRIIMGDPKRPHYGMLGCCRDKSPNERSYFFKKWINRVRKYTANAPIEDYTNSLNFRLKFGQLASDTLTMYPNGR